jgi:hypothetical protein
MKKKILIFSLIIILIACIFLNCRSLTLKKAPSYKNVDNSDLVKIKKILNNDSKFNNSKLNYDKYNNKIIINNELEVFIKNGYYLINVENKKENLYCNFVDAVEKYLGAQISSIPTCQKILNEEINIGGIDVAIYNDHKVLTINNKTLANLYDENKMHKKEDLINLDEINYGIEDENILMTSMYTNVDIDTKETKICGDIYAKENVNINFELYDENKKLIESKTLNQDAMKKYEPFCINFTINEKIPKFYKVNKDI